MYSVVYEQEAEEDLLAILLFYAEYEGLEKAIRLNNRIMREIEKLQTFPYRTKVSELFIGVREYLIGNMPYRAYLKVDEHTQTVYILNIVHTSRKT